MLKTIILSQVLVVDKLLTPNEVGGIEGVDELIENLKNRLTYEI